MGKHNSIPNKYDEKMGNPLKNHKEQPNYYKFIHPNEAKQISIIILASIHC